MTAIAEIYDKNKYLRKIRILLDTDSSANFIKESLAISLNLKIKKCCIPVDTINTEGTITKYIVTATIRSRVNDFEKTITCLTVPQIGKLIPSDAISRKTMKIPHNCPLADPKFHEPAPIDLILNAGATLSLFCMGQIDISDHMRDLYLQKARLGWVVGGSSRETTELAQMYNLTDLQANMARFWTIEEEPKIKYLSEEEKLCEEHFKKHTKRNEFGQYIVALPFKHDKGMLGESRSQAMKRLENLLRRLKRDDHTFNSYSNSMQEYIDLNHMKEISEINTEGFYLPHHGVSKESSATTKLRMVFDGSAKTSNGTSLNNTLMTGPTIQSDMLEIIMRFLFFKFVLSGDKEKMYRQVLVREEDRKFQRILWTKEDRIVCYEMQRITFGLACAPFLAIRCMHQLADDEKIKYPLAAKVLTQDMYVDNLLTGAESIEKARKIQKEMTQLLKKGGFHIRQWASNDNRILRDLSSNKIDSNFQFDGNQTLKTLGISWNAREDAIQYTVSSEAAKMATTKRLILAEIAKIYDPLGLLAPIILRAKTVMQQLWRAKLQWDESVPSHIYTAWSEFAKQLSLLDNVSFSRHVILSQAKTIELHGFCDASNDGYGACIYIRSVDQSNKIQTTLLCSKSRIAPLKTITIPRLELCGAILLASLCNHVKNTVNMSFQTMYLWTYSAITLQWIRTSPHLLKTFVANRVAKMQEATEIKEWHHISTIDNPADALSRGQTPIDFLKNTIWKEGPKWLKNHSLNGRKAT